MKIKYTGKKAEVISLLGGRSVAPGEKISVEDSLAAQLIKTKRWKNIKKTIKEKGNYGC